MDKEKLKQANEKLQVIKNIESQIQELICISKEQQDAVRYLRSGNQVTIPKELESIFNALLGDYYRRELEKTKKEFEEM